MKLAALCLMLLCALGCAKKEPKPLRTEPWLAHPPASASADGSAVRAMTRYVFGERSVIRFELPTKRGALRGSLTRVSGELNVDLSDLTNSRGVVRADLSSLDIHASAGTEGSDATLLERARAALELPADARAPATYASFELTSLEDDASPRAIEPPVRLDGGPPSRRTARITAVGNLLLHGFRVSRRAPLAADFEYTEGQDLPGSVLIRSRSPFVVSLETHAIVALASEIRAKGPASAAVQAREVRVSVELYGTKAD